MQRSDPTVSIGLHLSRESDLSRITFKDYKQNKVISIIITCHEHWTMFPLTFLKSLCAHKISCVQHFTSTHLYLEQHEMSMSIKCVQNIF